jgi:hypothetical protein
MGDGYICQFCGKESPASEWNKRGQACPKCGQVYDSTIELDCDDES